MLPSDEAKNYGGLLPGQWHVDPTTGIISLTEETFNNLINPDPIEKWYTLDPDPIARGQFAVVYHCHHRDTGEEFAAKFSSRWRCGAECTPDIEHEIAICAMLRSNSRVVRLVDVFSTDAEIILVMEYAPGGDLQTLLDEDLVPFERNVISFLKQLLEGLAFMHDRNIVHLDIKPQNLVLMGDLPDYSVKLCDFEISRMLTSGRDISQILGTADYVAPEILHYEPITTKTDMWSFGVLTYVLLTGFLPFGGDTDQETFLEITKAELDFPEELFEDISEHAIDFIKRLLIRKPHLRMSARECLEHPWMKSDSKFPKIPPQNLNLNFPINSASPLSKSSPNATLSPKQQKKGHSSTVPSTPTSVQNTLMLGALNDMELSSLKNNNSFELKSLRNCLSPTGTPFNITPNTLTPVSASPRETGLPPLYPHMSSRASQSTHSSTCSLNRGGSRQSLERLRSMSKSREVLFERMQMSSSQRKILSRSRERIFDGRHGLHRSKDQLFNNYSISHSVEMLPPFDCMHNEDCMYLGFNNTNNPMHSMTSALSLFQEKNNNRHYQSMASINQVRDNLTNMQKPHKQNSSFNSRFSINDEDYNSIVSQYNRNFNKNYQRSSNLTSSPERKEVRGIEKTNYDIRKLEHSRNNNERSPTPRNTREPVKSPSSPAVFQSHSTKNNIKKSKPEKIKRSKQNITQPILKNDESGSESIKPSGRRKGSGSHIEQRIQERHEKQEKKRKAEKSCNIKKQQNKTYSKISNNTVSPKSKNSKRNCSKINQKTNKKTFKTKQQVSSSSGSSPCSSMESVKEVQRGINNTFNKKQVGKVETILKFETKDNSLNSQIVNKNDLPKRTSDVKVEESTKPFEKKGDVDEAYVSLEEPIDDYFFSRSDSIDSSTSVGSGSTIKASDTDISEVTSPNIQINAKQNNSHVLPNRQNDVNKKVKINEPERLSAKQLVKKFEIISQVQESPTPDHLGVITEEEEESTVASFVRSISTSSDVSSVLSEVSEVLNDEIWKIRKGSETPPELNSRLRSYSVQTSASAPLFPFKLSRSNSIHLDSPLTGKARPWGQVCSGAVDRAYQLFSQKSTEFSFVGRKSSDPTSDRPLIATENNISLSKLTSVGT